MIPIRTISTISLGRRLKQKPVWDRLTAGYGEEAETVLLESLYVVEREARRQLVSLANDMVEGRTTLVEWQMQTGQQIRQMTTAGLRLGRGPQTGAADYGAIGTVVREQYALLDRFATQVYEGELTAKQILHRAGMYAWNLLRGFFIGQRRAKADAGYSLMQRFLTPGESCNDCIYYESLGKQPIGAIPVPGDRSACGNNCRCHIVYYRE